MKVFVISLKSSIERRNYTSQVLDRQAITFDFFDAEDINRDSEHFIFKLYNEKKSKRFKGYALTKPELGCFASHISLWRKCIDLNENILIMEDNFELSGNLKHQIANINQLTSDYGLVKIGNSIKREHVKILNIDNKYDLVSHLKGACGTYGYAISPSAARKYLSKINGFFEPVDVFMDNEWRTTQTLYSYNPPLSTRRDTVSTIGKRKVKSINIINMTLSEIYRAYKKYKQNKYNKTKA